VTRCRAVALLVGVGLAAVSSGCSKVPLYDVAASFSRADAAWFDEEDTLFFFYEVSAEQGIGEPSVVEVTWATDTERVDWTPIENFPTVHRHVDIDCGLNARCGSTSIAVSDPPREVDIRLRYHRDGELALDADTAFNAVGPGPAHTHRSLVVYGVFDETNQLVQWRGRHQFPTLRNMQATQLGLRRQITVNDIHFGSARSDAENNPYDYGVPCPSSFIQTQLAAVDTDLRAVFHPEPLPIEASTAAASCASATVSDATGTFTTDAWARKNPETRPAFPVLRSPVDDARVIPFFLAPCTRTIHRGHEQMQRQRLQMDEADVETTCTEGWDDPAWASSLAAQFSAAIEAQRPRGDDMVLVVGVHRDEDGVAAAIEDALELVVPEERHRSSPRVSGAFVFDSTARGLQLDTLTQSVLWCPTVFPDSPADVTSTAALTCAVAPDEPDFELGPFTFAALPILPSRRMYLDFINTYSQRQAGEVKSLWYRTPRFATTSDHVDLGEFGVVTFLNDERIPAEPPDQFSYCAPKNPTPVVFRSDFMDTPDFELIIDEVCDDGLIPEDFCETLSLGLLPLELLPEWHDQFNEANYELGLFWDFPFLLRMRFDSYSAGSVSAFGLSVPFGLAQNGQTYLGTETWLDEEILLDDILTQCTRFCGHATFDSAGVYHVTDPFWPTYASSCYLPDYPAPGDGGFPRDP